MQICLTLCKNTKIFFDKLLYSFTQNEWLTIDRSIPWNKPKRLKMELDK